MSGFRTPETPRDQIELWPHMLDEALPVDHPARLLDQLLHSSFFEETFREMAARYSLIEGKPPYHPRDLAGLYLFGMMNCIRSSRKLEAACYNRLDVIWLMHRQTPDHSTIAAFVRDHGKTLRKLLRDSIQIACKADLVDLGHVAIDGTKIQADAGKHSVHKTASIQEELNKLESTVASLEEEWKRNEEQERLLFPDRAAWCPDSKKTDRKKLANMNKKIEQMHKAIAVVKRRQAEARPDTKVSPIASVTDPDSRMMPSNNGDRRLNYNEQLAVDGQEGVIVAADVNDHPDDQGQLMGMIDKVEESCGQKPDKVSADSGYNNGGTLKALEENEVEGYLPDANSSSFGKPCERTQEALRKVEAGETLTEEDWAALPRVGGQIGAECFVYNEAADAFRCPAGETLPFTRNDLKTRKYGKVNSKRYGACTACKACAHHEDCCARSKQGRTLIRDEFEPYRERLRERMKTAEGEACYSKRRHTVEPRFGHIKRNFGIRRFMRRGLEAVTTEWYLICAVVNLQILMKHWGGVSQLL